MFKTLKFNRISEPSTIPPPPARPTPWWCPVVPAPGFAALIALSHDLGPRGPVVGDGLGERVEGSLSYGGKWDVEGLRRKQFPNFCVIFGGILAFVVVVFFLGGETKTGWQVGTEFFNLCICCRWNFVIFFQKLKTRQDSCATLGTATLGWTFEYSRGSIVLDPNDHAIPSSSSSFLGCENPRLHLATCPTLVGH